MEKTFPSNINIDKDKWQSIGHNGGPPLYEGYMYKWTNVENGKWYLGIKKDLLPEHGGAPYWTSSENEEFVRLRQGDDPLFKWEIIEVSNDYQYLQMKEYQILSAVSNIKTNPTTYNLSPGIPPLTKGDIPTEEYLTWFREQIDSGIWDQAPESVKLMMKLPNTQIRLRDDENHVRDIAYELKASGGNISQMNKTLILEGVGEVFGFDEESDVVAGGRHGLRAMAREKVLEAPATHVPYDVLKDKSSYFLRALGGFDNKNSEKLKYDSDYKDAAKLLVNLKEEFGIEPKSDLAKEQIRIVFGLKGRQPSLAIKQALIDLAANKKAGTKWKVWTKTELNTKQRNAENEETLARVMSSGLYKSSDILADLFKDNDPDNHVAQFRSRLKLIIHHPDPDAKDNFETNWSDWKKQLQFWLGEHEFTVDKMELDHEIEDTAGYDD